jgi:hypothetical protein
MRGRLERIVRRVGTREQQHPNAVAENRSGSDRARPAHVPRSLK